MDRLTRTRGPGFAATCFARLLALALITIPSVSGQHITAAGVGVVQVPFGETLYFYGSPDGHPHTAAPLDSLVFASGPHHLEVRYAPPWFAPDDFALDYDLLYLQAVSLRQSWVEVVVHTREVRWPPQTLWLDREAVRFRGWAEFLLEVHSVEPLDPEANPLRVAPHTEADPALSDQSLYRVLAVQSDWLFVTGADAREIGQVRGWLRWRVGDRLLIRYNLLS